MARRIIRSCNTRKGIFPYEYVSSWDRFEETQLPPIEAFYSKLSMSLINSDDYQQAQKVWKEFRIQDLGDYHDLYLKTDVVLLANVYKAFRETCLEHNNTQTRSSAFLYISNAGLESMPKVHRN